MAEAFQSLKVRNYRMYLLGQVVSVLHIVQPAHLYALAFVLGLATAVDNPTRQSFVVELVGVARLPNAIGLNSATFNVSRLVGPAIGGALLMWFGLG
jgi:MFS family permease